MASNTVTNSVSETVILLVAGAFHVGSAMDFLSSQLRQDGYDTRTMGLVSVNNKDSTIKHDVAVIKTEMLIPLIEQQGKDVVLYLHSYAGMPGSTAIKGFAKAERVAKGLKGGIIGLVYQSGFIPKEGQTVLGMVGGKYASWHDVTEGTGLIYVKDPKRVFCGDAVEPLATEAASRVYGSSILSHVSPSGPVYYKDKAYNGRRVYIHTYLDKALPPSRQEEFVEKSDIEWSIMKLNTSHSPFLSQPVTLAKLTETMTRNFELTYKDLPGVL